MGLEDNKDEIYKAFLAYVEHASKILTHRPSLKDKMVEDSIKLAYIDPAFRLRSLVEKLESSMEFNLLFLAVDTAVITKERESSKPRIRSHSIYSVRLPNFFKRSRFYSVTHRGKKRVPEDLFELFWSSLMHPKVKTTTLRLLDRVCFASNTLDHGIFRIHKFTQKALDQLIDRDVRETFYPDSQLNTEFASRYWFVVEENTSTIEGERLRGSLAWERNLPDRTLQLLALYEWTPDFLSEDVEWMGFSVPFSFRVD